MTKPLIRIGTRGSQLARWQADWVARRLTELGAEIEIVEITTRGDVDRTGSVAEIGTTGVFTKEIQAAVLNDSVDVAVHSLKDLPTETVEGLKLAAVPPREEVADALVGPAANVALADLPPGARVGTSSQRRHSQLLGLRPDLEVVPIRGNVETRIDKARQGECSAVILAAAGLIRLGLQAEIREYLRPPQFLPAPGQGALGLECRASDTNTLEILSQLEDHHSRAATDAERAMLNRLHTGCSAPVGAYGVCVGDELTLTGLVASLDGCTVLRASRTSAIDQAVQLGEELAAELLAQGAGAIIAEARGINNR